MYVNGKTLIRTRFAPSPSGWLHIGSLRTALFNYLYAKRYGGSFILRIDDTDVARNAKEYIKPILDGLKWLGITWDESYQQSHRIKHYREVAEGLIKLGLAYPDPSNGKEENKPYRGIYRNIPAETALELYDDTGWCLRFKMPDNEEIILDDLVKGEIKWNTSQFGDSVIIRAGTMTDDGWQGIATYN